VQAYYNSDSFRKWSLPWWRRQKKSSKRHFISHSTAWSDC